MEAISVIVRLRIQLPFAGRNELANCAAKDSSSVFATLSCTSTVSLTNREVLLILRKCVTISSVIIPCSLKHFQIPSEFIYRLY